MYKTWASFSSGKELFLCKLADKLIIQIFWCLLNRLVNAVDSWKSKTKLWHKSYLAQPRLLFLLLFIFICLHFLFNIWVPGSFPKVTGGHIKDLKSETFPLAVLTCFRCDWCGDSMKLYGKPWETHEHVFEAYSLTFPQDKN